VLCCFGRKYVGPSHCAPRLGRAYAKANRAFDTSCAEAMCAAHESLTSRAETMYATHESLQPAASVRGWAVAISVVSYKGLWRAGKQEHEVMKLSKHACSTRRVPWKSRRSTTSSTPTKVDATAVRKHLPARKSKEVGVFATCFLLHFSCSGSCKRRARAYI